MRAAPRKAAKKTVTRKRSVTGVGAVGSNKKFFVATTTGGFMVTAVNKTEAIAKGRMRIKDYNTAQKGKTGVKPLKYKTVHPV